MTTDLRMKSWTTMRSSVSCLRMKTMSSGLRSLSWTTVSWNWKKRMMTVMNWMNWSLMTMTAMNLRNLSLSSRTESCCWMSWMTMNWSLNCLMRNCLTMSCCC